MDLSSSHVAIFGPGVSQWDARRAGSLNPEESNVLNEVLNKMGELSGKAQGLSSPITTADKFRANTDVVYVICDQTGGILQGFLRLGRKHLFLYPDGDAVMREEDAICLLDFYVHETFQRKGVGFDLFTSAMEKEGLAPSEIAYDRPSPKLKPFLSTHFGLQNCLDQPNRFMIFKEFFGAVEVHGSQAG